MLAMVMIAAMRATTQPEEIRMLAVHMDRRDFES